MKKRHTLYLDKDTHFKFKALCAEHGITMSATIDKVIQLLVEGDSIKIVKNVYTQPVAIKKINLENLL